MDRVSDAQLIRALRCNYAIPDEDRCKGCFYCVTETWHEEEYLSCNYDKICIDAAARLEQLTRTKRDRE